MKLLSILFFSLAVAVSGQNTTEPCADETAAWEACIEANPNECGTCSASMEETNDSASAEGQGLDLSDAAALTEFLCNTLQVVGCVIQSCGCTSCSAEFAASMECSTEAAGLTNCDTTCQNGGGGGDGGSSAPGVVSVNMIAPILFGSLVLLA
jgi:hypothetical protein